MSIIDEIQKELIQAQRKFPPFNSAHEGIAVIEEEFLELRKEVFWGTPERGREEAIQLGAMAISMLLFYDRHQGNTDKGARS